MWENVLRQLGVFTVGVAALAWLCRTILVHWLGKDVEQYHSRLQQAHEAEIEKLRNELRLRSIEHEIRFRSTHERQAEALADTYSRLYQVHKAVSSYVAPLQWSTEPTQEEKLKTIVESYESFRSYFYARKILFPRPTGEQVAHLADRLIETANIFTREEWLERKGHFPPQGEPTRWDKSIDLMQKEIPPLLKRLEHDFQKLLGITDASWEDDGKAQEPKSN